MMYLLSLFGIAVLGMALMPSEPGGDEYESDATLPETDHSSSDQELMIWDKQSDSTEVGEVSDEVEILDVNTVSEVGNTAIKYLLHLLPQPVDNFEGFLIGDDGEDAIVGSENSDWLIGMNGEDLLQGGAGDDVLDGVSGENQVFSDYLRGGSGSDLLIGGALDRMAGGTGNDCFFVDTRQEQVHDGLVMIEDFDASSDEILIGYFNENQLPDLSISIDDMGATVSVSGQAFVVLEGVKYLSLDSITLVNLA